MSLLLRSRSRSGCERESDRLVTAATVEWAEPRGTAWGEVMSRLQVVRDGAFQRDEGLKAALAAVAAPSFIDEVGRLERTFDRCDTLYLLRDGHGEVLCFFLVAWEALDVEGRDVPTLYTGLCAARPGQKNTGSVVKLLNYCMFEAQQWEQRHREKLTIWGTTATPSVFFAARKIFANMQPSADVTYSEESAQLARAIGRRLGTSSPPGSHPFVFPRLAAGVRYSEEERRRIAAVCKAKQFFLFDQLGVDETRGDRLLFIAEVPAVLWRPVDWLGELPETADGPPRDIPCPKPKGDFCE